MYNLVHPTVGHETQSGSRSIALFFLQPRHWLVLGGQRHASVTPGKETRYPLHRKLGGPVWTGAKKSPPPGQMYSSTSTQTTTK